MRDPKTHAKVLAARIDAVLEALHSATIGSRRWSRLVILSSQVGHKRYDHHRRTGESYPLHWQHTEIVPDAEEEA